MAKRTYKQIWADKISKAAEPWRNERVQKLCEAFNMGNNVEDACRYARIPTSTYYYWIKKYPKILEEIDHSKTHPVIVASRTLMKGLENDTRLAFDYLQKKRSADFAPTKVALEGSLKVEDETSPSIAAKIAFGVGEALRKANEEANKTDEKKG